MNKHTPGPWELTQSNKCWPGYYVKHPDNMVGRIPGYFAEIRAYTSNQNTIKANAHLIAAAPDLYEALDALRAELFLHAEGNYFRPLLDKAEDALMKARGEI